MEMEETADDRDATAQTAIVLLGRGMPHGEQWATLNALAERLRKKGPYRAIRIAFLEMTEPSIAAVLDELDSEGCQRAVIVPCFVPFDRNIAGWLGRSLSQRRQAGRIRMDVAIAPDIDKTEAFSAAIEVAVSAGLAREDVATAFRPLREKPTDGQIPPHRDQIFVCLGPRCTEAGAWEVLARLRAALKRESLDINRSDAVTRSIVCRSSCLFPCAQAPVVIVQPDRAWYGKVTPEAADTIVTSHLRDRKPVDHLLLKSEAPQDDPSDWPLASARIGPIKIDGMFARFAMKKAGALAVFGSIETTDNAPDHLLGASSPLARLVGIHGPDRPHENLSPKMFGVWPIIRGTPLCLRPGGLHMMLFDVQRDLAPGESFPLGLEFGRAGHVGIDVTVQPGH
jgi:(2Fe-2S) ferredoxin